MKPMKKFLPKTISLIGVVSLLTFLPQSVQASPAVTQVAQANSEQIFQQGLDKIDAGNYKEAAELLTKALELNPKDPEAYYNRAIAFAQLSEYEKAIADYSQVLELTPNDEEAYYNRGLARAELADDEGAIADFTQALQRKSDYAEAYYNRALARAELSDDKQAIEDFQTAASLFTKQGKKDQAEQALALIKKIQP
jgi:tetratricopeptide (TPR) repeat protein